MTLATGNNPLPGARPLAPPRPSRPVRAFTLVEMVLVLALLATVAALVVPVISGGFVTVRLRRGGDRVLAAWAQARAEAIESGEVLQFQYQPKGDAFRIEPWTPPVAETSATTTGLGATPGSSLSPPPATSASSTATAAPAADAAPIDEGELPEGITFYAGQGVISETAMTERQLQQLSASGTEWSSPVLFFPDGSTSDASVTIASDKGHFQRLTLRGLTGVGRGSLVLTRRDLTRLESAEQR